MYQKTYNIKHSKPVSLLLTACVNPNGMSFTALQNKEERKQQYKNALSFYLAETIAPIIFIENTGIDFSSEYEEWIKKGRLEYITFDGNNYSRSLGKGYGEALIINEAIKRSRFLQESKYVIKITGRLIIKNINQILSSPWLRFNNVFRADLRESVHLWTTIFVIETKELKNIFSDKINIINDSKGVFFEHALYNGLIEDNTTLLVPFFRKTEVEGISGTVGKTYLSLMSKYQLQDNLYYTYWYYKESKRRWTSLLWYAIYRLYLLYNKII